MQRAGSHENQRNAGKRIIVAYLVSLRIKTKNFSIGITFPYLYSIQISVRTSSRQTS